MKKTTVIIPNYNGIRYLENCIKALLQKSDREASFDILIVDNGSTDGSEDVVKKIGSRILQDGAPWRINAARNGSGQKNMPMLSQIRLKENTGFCGAVNVGIQAAQTPYVLLLNNDTVIRPGFVEQMTGALEQEEMLFSVSARMLSMEKPDRIDDAGDLYCALGWAFARGKGKRSEAYDKPANIFAACGGAAIYRKDLLEKLGGFDPQHFAYLEDIDVAYRALIHGYRNRYEPSARVLHAGSGTTGSAHNPFKVRLSARNSVYLAYKNMPFLQLMLNAPFLLCGHVIKFLYFWKKHMAGDYAAGLKEGVALCFSKEGRARKVPFRMAHMINYVKIQWMLWVNLFRRFG